MKDIYKAFKVPVDGFEEEARGFIYDLSLEMINNARKDVSIDWYKNIETVRAILLLLFTWNFAAPITKTLNNAKIFKLLKSNREMLDKLAGWNIVDCNLMDDNIINFINKVFVNFKTVLGQTGASKALSLLNPAFFVMWDTKIRKYLNKNYSQYFKGIGNGENDNSYFLFLKGTQNLIREYDLDQIGDKSKIAKRLDELHYVEIVMKENQ